MKALVLAGGFPQIALIQELHSRGIVVVLADWNKEPVAKKYADIYYQVSTLDVEAIRKVAVDEAVDFLITVCTDQALLTVAKVSEELGLPCYIDYRTALNVTNKQYMKEVFVKHNIPAAKHIVLDEFREEDIAGFQFPLIVKPVDCNSSKGVVKVTGVEELVAAFAQAKAFSRTHTAIIEEFIQGQELSVDAYVEDGTATVTSVSVSEKIQDNEKFVIFRSLYPANISEALQKQISETVQKIATAFGLRNCPMLIQMLSDGENAYVIEFSARTGGGTKYLLIETACGFDVIKAVVDLTLGEPVHLQMRPAKKKYLISEFIYCKPGEFHHLEGFDEAKQQGIIKDYYPFIWQGAQFDAIASSGDRVAGFSIEGDTLEELQEKHLAANKMLCVADPQGRDIMRHDLLTDVQKW